MCAPTILLRQRAQQFRLQIAIDGPAGSGKSTVGRGLAGILACAYVDTGLMYRAVTLKALEYGLSLDDEQRIVLAARQTVFTLEPHHRLWIDGRSPTPELQSPTVDAAVSQASAHPAVREVLVAQQQTFARGRAIVMVGRDIGTVVLPSAPLKLWVTASVEERARRRGAEQIKVETGGADISTRLRARDHFDSMRQASPLRPADEVLILDTSNCSAEEALDVAVAATQTVLDALAR